MQTCSELSLPRVLREDEVRSGRVSMVLASSRAALAAARGVVAVTRVRVVARRAEGGQGMGVVGRQVVGGPRPGNGQDIRQSMRVVGWRGGVQLEERVQEESFVKLPTLGTFVPPSPVQASGSLPVVAPWRSALTRRQAEVAVAEETASVVCV